MKCLIHLLFDDDKDLNDNHHGVGMGMMDSALGEHYVVLMRLACRTYLFWQQLLFFFLMVLSDIATAVQRKPCAVRLYI